MNKLLITRPNHDITVNYLFHWSMYVINYAKRVKKEIIDISGNRANKNNFTGITIKTAPDLIILNGHGNPKTVCGQNDEPLVQEGKNEEILKNKVVYAISCSSAQSLGKVAVKKGAKAYIGYDEDFVFMIDNNKVTKPLNDKSAELFLKPAMQVGVSLLKGHSAKESTEISKKHFLKNIQSLLTSDTMKTDKELLPYLVWDMNHQICLS